MNSWENISKSYQKFHEYGIPYTPPKTRAWVRNFDVPLSEEFPESLRSIFDPKCEKIDFDLKGANIDSISWLQENQHTFRRAGFKSSSDGVPEKRAQRKPSKTKTGDREQKRTLMSWYAPSPLPAMVKTLAEKKVIKQDYVKVSEENDKPWCSKSRLQSRRRVRRIGNQKIPHAQKHDELERKLLAELSIQRLRVTKQ